MTPDIVIGILFTIGLSLCGSGDADSGIRLVSATRQMWHVAGVGVAEEPFEQAVFSRVEKSARTTLGAAYEAAVAAGEALTRDQAIALGLSITPGRPNQATLPPRAPVLRNDA